jgi:hypothetical protein
MTIVDEVREINLRARQKNAVGDHLVRHGVISKHTCVYDGLDGVGIVQHPGARIFELRADGWLINTVKGPNTHWHLVNWPGQGRPAAPSFAGFLAWLKERDLQNVEGKARGELYKKYLAETK